MALRNLARAWAACLSERAHARGGGTGCGEAGWAPPYSALRAKDSGAGASALGTPTTPGAGAGGEVALPGALSRLWWCCELSGPDALLLDVHRLEGFVMGRGLVSADEGIRREALQVGMGVCV